METLTKDLTDIIISQDNTINEKLKGLNYLEALKLKLIDNILPIILKKKFPLSESIEFEQKSENSIRNLTISINYYSNPISITRKIVDHDSLFISFNETSSIDIYNKKNANDFKSLVLYKNTGLCLPIDTQINAKINKNTLFISVNNNDAEQTLTN